MPYDCNTFVTKPLTFVIPRRLTCCSTFVTQCLAFIVRLLYVLTFVTLSGPSAVTIVKTTKCISYRDQEYVSIIMLWAGGLAPLVPPATANDQSSSEAYIPCYQSCPCNVARVTQRSCDALGRCNYCFWGHATLLQRSWML